MIQRLPKRQHCAAFSVVLTLPAILHAQTPALWRLSPQPLVSIGVLEGEAPYMLSQVNAALRLNDGRIVVANGASNELRVFDARGRHLGSYGRTGTGPGEYEWLRTVLRGRADSLFAMDSRTTRLTVLTPTFQPVATVQFPQIEPQSRSDDGSYLLIGSKPNGDYKPGLLQFTGLILRFQPGAARPDTLARIPEAGVVYLKDRGQGVSVWGLPFAPEAKYAVSASSIFYSKGDAAEILRFDRNGRALPPLRINTTRRAVTRADVQKLLDWLLSTARTEQQKASRREVFAEMKPSDRMPAHGALKTDLSGNLWVQRYAPPYEEGLDWEVYSPEGRRTATVKLPARFQMLEIGRDYVLGVFKDEFDVERVHLYRLDRQR